MVLVVRCLRSVVCYLVSEVCCRLFVVGCVLLVVCDSLTAVFSIV